MQSEFDYVIEQLDYAKEQLAMADDLYSKDVWGSRCDQLEATLSDMLGSLNIL